ncbi:MAG: hypothetical protein KGZ58_00180 [Ignavibacteriales bacterium]|nr:hypothetical protein [Ignavibacteriales bacterium]
MKLPNGEQAIIPEAKLEEYCLNPLHPDGKHKAKVFEKALGFSISESDELRKLVLESAEMGNVTKQSKNNFGTLYRVEHTVQGLLQEEILVTLWIIPNIETQPYLTTSYIKTRKGK